MNKFLFAACLTTLGFFPAFAAQSQYNYRNGSGQNQSQTQAPMQNQRQYQMPAQSGGQQMGQIRWYTSYSEAAAVAKKENKPLLLFFTGSDWCGWCKKMHQEVFSSSEFAQSVGNNFIFVEVDFPMNKPLPSAQQQENNQLKQKYGITGYPTIIILDPNGNFIAETGYRPGGGKAYADYLKQLLK